MDWLSLVLGVVKLLGVFTQWLHDRQMINAGQAEQVAKDLTEQGDAIRKAVAARLRARDDAERGKLRDDDGFKRN